MVKQKCKTCAHWGYEGQKTRWRPCTHIGWAFEEPKDHEEVKTLECSTKAMVFAEELLELNGEESLEPIEAKLYCVAEHGCNEHEEEG